MTGLRRWTGPTGSLASVVSGVSGRVSGVNRPRRGLGASRPGPYFSTWGSRDGPIRYRDRPPALDLVSDQVEPAMPVGIAYPVGWTPDPKGRPPAATFRLAIGAVALPGLYVCVGRRFVAAAEWEAGS